MPRKYFLSRQAYIRPRSRHPRNGLGYLRYDALWRYSEEAKYCRLQDRASRLLLGRRVMREVNPTAFYRSPWLPKPLHDDEQHGECSILELLRRRLL